jgi:hypothetical protein
VTPRIDDPDEVQLDAPRLQTLQQADATTEHHRHQIDHQLVQQASPQTLLHQLRPHDEDIPPRPGRETLSVATSGAQTATRVMSLT